MAAITVSLASTVAQFAGLMLRVKVLTGTATSQTGAATATHSGTGAQEASITTTQTGSLVYGALKTSSTTTLTAASGTTLIDNIVDSNSTEILGSCRTTSATGTPGATTVGASAPSVGGQAALLEILPSGTITEDSSSPAVASSVTNGVYTVTTASFTPPAGSLLVAIGSVDASASTVITVSDSSSLTWTQRVHSQAAGGASGYAGVWTAAIPAGGTHNGSATPSVTATVTAAANVTHKRGATLTVTATPSVGAPAPPVPFNAIPGLLTPGRVQPGNPDFVYVAAQAQTTVTATVTAGALSSLSAGANRPITATVTAAAKVTRHGNTTRTVTASRNATGAAVRHRSESRPVTVTITAGAAKPGNTHSAGTRPVFTAAFQAAAAVQRHRGTAKTITCNATAAAVPVHHRSASRPVTVTVTAGAVIPGGNRTAARPVTATITAHPAHTTNRSGVISATATITARAGKTSPQVVLGPVVTPYATATATVTPQAD